MKKYLLILALLSLGFQKALILPDGTVNLICDTMQPPVDEVRYIQNDEGLLSIHALGFAENIPSETNQWVNDNGYMVTANNNVKNETANIPELKYNVTFVKSGTHYIWVHSETVDSSSDSIHYGIDGNFVGSITFLNNLLSNDLQSGGRAEFTVNAGEHTLNIWMREDGTKFDKIYITDNESLNIQF